MRRPRTEPRRAAIGSRTFAADPPGSAEGQARPAQDRISACPGPEPVSGARRNHPAARRQLMDGRGEGARDLVLAIFRLAVCDYRGLSYAHDGPDRTRACRTRQHLAEAGLFLRGALAAHLADIAGF